MKPAAVILTIAFAATLWGQQQPPGAAAGQLKPMEPPKPRLQIGEVDPKHQCQPISQDKPELEPVEKACEAAVAGAETLPNFLCDMNMTRKQPMRRTETITGELRFIDGEEELSDAKINGVPTDERSLAAGVMTKGEFGPPGLTVLSNVSSPEFTFRGEEKSQTGTMLVFDYRVARENNQSWAWHIAPYEYKPGFHGVLLIDKETGLLKHISLVASGDEIETFVPTLSNSVSTDYALVKVGELGQYQLPVHSELKHCGRFYPGCVEIERNFVNCRKFAAKARIVE